MIPWISTAIFSKSVLCLFLVSYSFAAIISPRQDRLPCFQKPKLLCPLGWIPALFTKIANFPQFSINFCHAKVIQILEHTNSAVIAGSYVRLLVGAVRGFYECVRTSPHLVFILKFLSQNHNLLSSNFTATCRSRRERLFSRILATQKRECYFAQWVCFESNLECAICSSLMDFVLCTQKFNNVSSFCCWLYLFLLS